MNTNRIAIFIDGAYFDKTNRDECGLKVDYAKLALKLAGGIDIQLGVDLVLLSAKQQISHATVIAGDSDLIPALCVAKNEGVLVHLFHGSAPHRKLVETSDERTQITHEFLTGVQYTG